MLSSCVEHDIVDFASNSVCKLFILSQYVLCNFVFSNVILWRYNPITPMVQGSMINYKLVKPANSKQDACCQTKNTVNLGHGPYWHMQQIISE